MHSQFVYLCMSACYSDFSMVTKNQVLAIAVQAQHDNVSNLDFYIIKALFTIDGVICLP